MEGKIYQLNSSQGGVPKLPVAEAGLTPDGLDCDKVARLGMHGGPERALCLFSLDLIRRLQAEGHPIEPGSTGENVTVEGIDWDRLTPGVRLALGDEAVVEISSYTTPCRTIKASFQGHNYSRISQKKHPGESRVYARVVRTGRLSVGQPVRLIS